MGSTVTGKAPNWSQLRSLQGAIASHRASATAATATTTGYTCAKMGEDAGAGQATAPPPAAVAKSKEPRTEAPLVPRARKILVAAVDATATVHTLAATVPVTTEPVPL